MVDERTMRLLTILGTQPVTTSKYERVFSKLQRTFYYDEGSTILLQQCHCEHCVTPDELCTVAETAEVVLSIDMIISIAAFCSLSCIDILIFCFTLQTKF